MGIEKIGTKVAQTLVKRASSTEKAMTSAAKILQEFKPMTKVLENLPKDAFAHKYSTQTMESIENFRKVLYDQIKLKFGTGELAQTTQKGYDCIIGDVLTYCKSGNIAKSILSSVKNLNTYNYYNRKNKSAHT